MNLLTVQKTLIAFVAIMAVITAIFYFDYSYLSWEANGSNYIALLTAACLAVSMALHIA